MFKFCPNCGEKLPDNVKFCPHCGYQLPQHTQSTLPTQPTESSSEAQPTQPSVTNPVQATQPTSSTQTTQETRSTQQNTSSQSNNSYNYAAEPYNGTSNPNLIPSSRLWLQTFYKPDQCMGRADFWWGYLGASIVSFFLPFVGSFLLAGATAVYLEDSLGVIFVLLVAAVALFISVMTVFTMVQRLHDTGHSGYNWLWCLTGIGAIYVIVLLAQPTDWNYTEFPRYHYEIK